MRSRLPEIAFSQLGNYADALDRPESLKSKRGERYKVQSKRLARVLTVGNWLYKAVRRIENNWRTEVLEGQTPYDPNEERSIEEMLRQWVAPCERCLEQIRFLQEKHVEVAGAKQFRAYCQAAKEILAGRNSFFDDTTKAWRWFALTAKHRPPIRPILTDSEGRIYETTGQRFVPPGLTPEDVREAFSAERDAETKPLQEVIAARQE